MSSWKCETCFDQKQDFFHQSRLFQAPTASDLPIKETLNRGKKNVRPPPGFEDLWNCTILNDKIWVKRTVRTPPGFESKQCDWLKFNNNHGERTVRLENQEPERKSPEEWKKFLIKQNQWKGPKWLEFIGFIDLKLSKDPNVILDPSSLDWKITFDQFVQLLKSFVTKREVKQLYIKKKEK